MFGFVGVYSNCGMCDSSRCRRERYRTLSHRCLARGRFPMMKRPCANHEQIANPLITTLASELGVASKN